jgi:transketolase
MRNTFAAEITEMARSDERVVLLSGDIGNRLFDAYKEDSGDRFFNCGVAEQNMMTMAAGLALRGMRPFVYTITPFVTTRCLEQIRVDVCYHEAPVTIVGTGSGFSYGALGPTHHSLEDVGILRLLPGMTVICPGDPTEVRLAARAALAHDGPVYLRIGKKGEPVVHRDIPEFRIGKGIEMRSGDDLYLVSTGTMLPVVVDASEQLGARGLSVGVISMHTVKPLDTDLLGTVFEKVRLVATIEEHSMIGGLGGAVAEWYVDEGISDRRLLRFGTRDEFLREPGEQGYARAQMGLAADELVDRILPEWQRLVSSTTGTVH